MTLLSKDAILQAHDLPTRDVPVPEWGGTARVRTLTGADRAAFGEALAAAGKADAGKASFTVHLVAWTLIDEDGQRLFSTDEVHVLERKSSVALERVAAAAMALNGMGPAALEAATGN